MTHQGNAQSGRQGFEQRKGTAMRTDKRYVIYLLAIMGAMMATSAICT